MLVDTICFYLICFAMIQYDTYWKAEYTFSLLFIPALIKTDRSQSIF